MNPFTGGCHFDDQCGRFAERCGRCPQLQSSIDDDLSRAIWHRKREAYADIPVDRLHLVAQSRWMQQCLLKSPLLGRFPNCVIPNGVDLERFAPGDKLAARRHLELPAASHVILFVADTLNSERKGFAHLLAAFQQLPADGDVLLVSVGRECPALDTSLKHLPLGVIHNDELLRQAYCAADVFVVPSLQDNLPNTVLEAMACGTPVVAFDVGGIPDMVHDGVTGRLVAREDDAALAEAMAALLADEPLRRSMSAASRRLAVAEFDVRQQGVRYEKLYERVMEQARNKEVDSVESSR